MTRPRRDDDQASPGCDLQRRQVLGGVARTLLSGSALMAGLSACSTPSRSSSTLRPDWPTVTSANAGIVPKPGAAAAAAADPKFANVAARTTWTTMLPDYKGMNRMTPIGAVTVHHDGLPSPLGSTRTRDAQDRLRTIRRGHVNHNGWADIGYHFAVDRSGRIWSCRPLTWQGAHVKNRNEGNIGVLVLGNFEIERPTSAQLNGLAIHLKTLVTAYRISPRKVYTHREWPGAATACPGRNLQPAVNRIRARGLVA
ncbi:MAG: N-acetylmuramoyl-L-alanine amidase [Phycisphaera sp. TMED9]|nr:MAG: N-acetylmuramoyl-L-alanine amidase [Phycisphaera sp. TMED9]